MNFLGTYDNGAKQSSYTFNVGLGAASLNRKIVLVIQSDNEMVGTVSVGGVPSTKLHAVETNSYISYWMADVPTGITDTISISMIDNPARIAIAVYSVDADNVTVHDSDTRQTEGNMSIDVPAGGAYIGVIARNSNISVDFTGLVEDFEEQNSGEGARWAAASGTFVSEELGFTLPVVFGDSPSVPTAVVVSFALSTVVVTPPAVTDPTAEFTPVAIDFPTGAGGRLTTTADAPVITADDNSDVLYYTAHKSNLVPLHDGTEWKMHGFLGNPYMTLGLTANTVYDVFIYETGGILKLGVGSAWTDTETRAVELGTVNGVYVNDETVDGVVAGQALYVGTIYTNANGNLDMDINPAPSNGGNGNVIGIWNMYNRVLATSRNIDNQAEYNYNTATTRVKGGSLNNGVTMVVGVEDDVVKCYSGARCDTSSQVSSRIGIGLDSTSVISSFSNTPEFALAGGAGGSQDLTGTSIFVGHVGIGKHTLYALERAGSGGGTVLWRDNHASTDRHYQGMQLQHWC